MDDAARAKLAAAAVGTAAAPGSLVPSDVDVDAVLARQLTRDQLQDMARRDPYAAARAESEGRLLALTHVPDAIAPAPTPTPPGQLTRADVEAMAGRGDHAGIEQARREGRLSHAMGQGQ